MTWLDAVLLGLVQGATEFLPVSSDGHLSAVQMLMPHFRQVGVLFDVLAHVGTLAALVIYFRRLLKEEAASLFSRDAARRREATKLAGLVLLAVVPTGIVGVLLKPIVERVKEAPRFVGVMEILTGLLVLAWVLARRGRRELASMTALDALLIGVAQGLAVMPGLSRSASTIAVALLLGVSGAWAARFSLRAAIPAILAAAAFELISAWRALGPAFFATPDFAKYLVGAAVAGAVGYLTIPWLLRLVSSRRVLYFAIYCFLFGVGLILLLA